MIRRQAERVACRFRYGYATRCFNVWAFLLLVAACLAAPSAVKANKNWLLVDNLPIILVLGDSLSSGYGLPEDKSFPAQLEQAMVRGGYHAQAVINGGVAGDTSAGGLARLDWELGRGPRPYLVIVELGANDGLRGLDPAATRENLDRIIRRVLETGAHVLLAGMRAPPNLGEEYGAAFKSVYEELATSHEIAYYPFFLEGVAAVPAFNQDDGIHPNAEGVAVIVEKILPHVIRALEGPAP